MIFSQILEWTPLKGYRNYKTPWSCFERLTSTSRATSPQSRGVARRSEGKNEIGARSPPRWPARESAIFLLRKFQLSTSLISLIIIIDLSFYWLLGRKACNSIGCNVQRRKNLPLVLPVYPSLLKQMIFNYAVMKTINLAERKYLYFVLKSGYHIFYPFLPILFNRL